MKRTYIIIMAALLLTGCQFNLDGSNVDLSYEHPERYSMGDAKIAQPVRSVSINWRCGDIDILYSDITEVRIHEETDSSLTEDLRLRYYVDEEGELEIQYCANGKQRYDNLKALSKHLYVELPRGMNLDEIEIDGVDVMVAVDRVQHRELSVDGVDMNVNAYYPGELPDKIGMDGVKNLLALHVVPETAGLTIEMDGVVKHLACDLPSTKQDSKTIVGDGRCRVEVDGVDVKLSIRKLV